MCFVVQNIQITFWQVEIHHLNTINSFTRSVFQITCLENRTCTSIPQTLGIAQSNIGVMNPPLPHIFRKSNSRVRFPTGLGIFLFTTASRTALGPTQPPIQWVPVLSLVVKRLGREADHSPPSRVEVKEWVELYLYSPIRLHGVVLS
jgi:hypothetical protein